MKKLLTALFCLFASPSLAGVSCVLPFTLTNGTLADASQVMANYNQLVTCLASAAASGANSDITSLSGLTTPLSPSQGGSPYFTANLASTGTANAQVVATTIPSSFSLTLGYTVTFVAGFSNTAATTLNINGTGVKNLFRRSQLGLTATVGGEIVAGDTVTVAWDGTEYQLVSIPRILVGELKNFSGTGAAPAGHIIADGTCQLRAGVLADLFTVISTSYDPTGSTCDALHFALPDGRGRTWYGLDNMGVGAANRITSGGSGCNGALVGSAGCGAQNQSIGQANLPNVTLTTSIASGQGNHSHDIRVAPIVNSSGFISSQSNSNGSTITGASGGGVVAATLPAMTGTTPTGGSGTALTTLSPGQMVTKIVKY